MGFYTKNGGLIGYGKITEKRGVYDLIASQIHGGIALVDYTQITNTSALAFSYFAMPSGPRTMLNYITSFGVTNNSQNTNTSSWSSGYDSITATATPITTNNYFSSGNVDIIKGDGTSSDYYDWVIFYFKGTLGDFDGYWNSSGSAWLAGEDTRCGATNGGSVTVGRVWGYEGSTGWNVLYLLSLASGTHSKNHSNWWNSGGSIVTSGAGKYTAYDNLNITHFGFSVGTS